MKILESGRPPRQFPAKAGTCVSRLGKAAIRETLERYREQVEGHFSCGFGETGRTTNGEVDRVRALLVAAWIRKDKGEAPATAGEKGPGTEDLSGPEAEARAISIGRSIVERGEPSEMFRLLNVLVDDPMTKKGSAECRELTESCQAKLLALAQK